MTPLFHFSLNISDTQSTLATFHELPVYYPHKPYLTHLFDYLFFDDPILKSSNNLTFTISIKFSTFFPDRQLHAQSFLLNLFAYLNFRFYFCCTGITLNPFYDSSPSASSPGTLRRLEELLQILSRDINQYQTFNSYFLYHVSFSYARLKRPISQKTTQDDPEIPF